MTRVAAAAPGHVAGAQLHPCASLTPLPYLSRAVPGRGVVMRWHVSQLVPQATWRVPRRLPGDEDDDSDEEEEDCAEEQQEGLEGQKEKKEEDDSDDETEFKEHIGWRVSRTRQLTAAIHIH